MKNRIKHNPVLDSDGFAIDSTTNTMTVTNPVVAVRHRHADNDPESVVFSCAWAMGKDCVLPPPEVISEIIAILAVSGAAGWKLDPRSILFGAAMALEQFPQNRTNTEH